MKTVLGSKYLSEPVSTALYGILYIIQSMLNIPLLSISKAQTFVAILAVALRVDKTSLRVTTILAKFSGVATN